MTELDSAILEAYSTQISSDLGPDLDQLQTVRLLVCHMELIINSTRLL